MKTKKTANRPTKNTSTTQEQKPRQLEKDPFALAMELVLSPYWSSRLGK